MATFATMRYFLDLSYRGTAYNGWQRQPDAPSVQQALEGALSTLLRTETGIVGAGRTDTGVHASHYTAHFDAAVELDSADFLYHLNSVLPEDIAVHGLRRVKDQAHARFDALRREYKYYLLQHKDPFRRQLTWQYYVDLDMDKMNSAARMLLGCHEFTAFSKLHSANKTDMCTVVKSQWDSVNGDLIYTIAADRFLRNMVRSITGTLVDVGRGKITPERFGEILASRDRSLASGSAPAQGLFLTDVAYPDEIFI